MSDDATHHAADDYFEGRDFQGLKQAVLPQEAVKQRKLRLE